MTPDPSEATDEHREWLAQGSNDRRIGVSGDEYNAAVEEHHVDRH